jgi:hypothetical protein
MGTKHKLQTSMCRGTHGKNSKVSKITKKVTLAKSEHGAGQAKGKRRGLLI